MKTLKLIFTIGIFTMLTASCTPQALDDDQTNAEGPIIDLTINDLDTGDDDEETGEGGNKD